MQKQLRLIISCGLIIASCAQTPTRDVVATPQLPPMAKSDKGLVVTCQSIAAQVGLDILKTGGNAADAFVAATVAEYVTAPGYTSLSGPLYVLYYDKKSGKTTYLNAGLNTVADKSGQWNDQKQIPGTAYVIGGAGRGIEALYNKFGSHTYKFKDLIAPSVALAKNGFVLDRSFAGAIRARARVLKNSAAWTSVYTSNGKPLAVGNILVQPAMAETLNNFADKGADYLFKGKYAKNLVKFITAQGGKLTLKDLANYQVQWSEPLEAQYRGLTIQTSSYRSYGGLELLLDLKAIENFDFSNQPHFSKDIGIFDKVARTFIFSKHEIFHYMKFENREDDPQKQREIAEGPLSKKVWAEVTDVNTAAPPTKDIGSHSCSPVIIDKEGNIAAGVHTINTLQWGDFGFMVDGIALNTAHDVALDAPPGTRAIDGLNPVLVFKNGTPLIAASFFSSGLHAAGFQTLLNLIDYKMNPQQAIGSPRFGPPTSYKPLQMVLDKRFPADWISNYAKQGIVLSQPEGFVDTGMAMVIAIDPATDLRSGSPTDLLRFAIVGDNSKRDNLQQYDSPMGHSI